MGFWELHDLCVKNDWFVGGTDDQYSKLFEMARNGATTDELARIIWLCTPDSNFEEIKGVLESAV